MTLLKAVWAYRGFILGSVKREFQSRYVGSLLGTFWLFAQPLCLIFVYTVIFSHVMKARIPGVDSTYSYSLYLCAGLLPWIWFSEVLTRCQSIFLDNAGLIKKANFPRICLPVICALSATVNFFLMFFLFTAFTIAVGMFPGWAFAGLLPLFCVQMLFSVGLGILLGVVNVFVRDVAQVMGVALQFWFWLTPIVYPEGIFPPSVKFVLNLNPLTHLVRAYHDIFIHGRFVVGRGVGATAFVAVAVFALAYAVYKRAAGDLVDEL